MSHKHFKGQFEVELKYRLACRVAFLAVLNSIEYEVMFEDNIESDCYFDTPTQQLLAQHKSVCIRECEPSGIKLWIVKGPDADRCQASNITDAKSAKSMLETMGYQVCLQMTKQRSIYFVGKFHITLDHLAGLGDFAEFAIMTDDEDSLEIYRAELVDLAAQFGLTQDQLEHRSYRSMQEAK